MVLNRPLISFLARTKPTTIPKKSCR